MNKPILDMENVLRLVFKVALPAILSNVITALFYIVDTKFVSRLGLQALSAMSIVYPINIFSLSIMVGMGIGVTSILSNLLGKRDIEEASIVAGNSLLISAALGVLFTVVGLFFSESLVSLISSHDSAADAFAVQYLRVLLVGSLALFLPTTAADILKGEGNTVTPMFLLIFGVLLNAILDPIMIFGYFGLPAMGMSGAALATVISSASSGLLSLSFLFNRRNIIVPSFKGINRIFDTFKTIFLSGISPMIASMLTSVVIFFINFSVAKYDKAALSFTGLMITISDSLILLPIYGLAQGFIPIASYNYGANNMKRLREAVKYSLIKAGIISLTGGLVFILFARDILSLFIEEAPNVIEAGVVAFRIVGISYILSGPMILAASAFQSMGKGLKIALVAVMRSVAVFMPLAMIASEYAGIKGMWIAFTATETVAFVVILTWLYFELKE